MSRGRQLSRALFRHRPDPGERWHADLSGANTFSGNITLTGGELIAGSIENVGVSGPLGQGGIISFNGGTLGFSANNNFDYSPRFSTAAGQAYSIDTAGQNVTFANNLGSSGGSLTKLGGGTLTLSGTSSYSGLTTVSGGKLAFQGPKTGSGDITVADGATLGVFDTGTQVAPNTLTLGTSGSTTLEFDNVNSTTTAPLAPVTFVCRHDTINVNSGTFPIVLELSVAVLDERFSAGGQSGHRERRGGHSLHQRQYDSTEHHDDCLHLDRFKQQLLGLSARTTGHRMAFRQCLPRTRSGLFNDTLRERQT